MITCPACAVDIDFDEEDLDEGDLFDCTECGGNLRVLSLKPLELVVVKDDAAAADEDEDEFDEDEDEDDDEKDDDEKDENEDELEEEEDEEEEWN